MSSRLRKAISGLMCLSLFAIGGCDPQVVMLSAAGPVARTEERLIWLSLVLVSIVVIPVMLLLWYIVRRYRDRPDNEAPYDPEWSESKVLEVIWWSIPIVIVSILGAFTARDTFALTRPPKPVQHPLTIEVTSLNWKWLFQYPGQDIATVNYCEIPTNQPVEFVLTANAPMNSFWVPRLGGQEYTMPGMAMRLWLQADQPGKYYGTGAQFTGEGYAHMHFDVVAVSDDQFRSWVDHVKHTAPPLTEAGYAALARPSIMGKQSYSSYPPGSFRRTVMREGGMYMKHCMSILDSLR